MIDRWSQRHNDPSILQFGRTSKLRISPGSHSTATSMGRQQISQSVVNRCEGWLVSMSHLKFLPAKWALN